MNWLLKDFDLLSVILRACTLSLEAVTLGGLIFLLWVARPFGSQPLWTPAMRSNVSRAAIAFVLVQAGASGLSLAVLTSTSGLPLGSFLTAGFFLAAVIAMLCALLLALLLRRERLSRRSLLWVGGPLGAGLLAASVAMSHAASRMDHRLLLAVFTAAHHLGTAGWVGAMLFLLLSLRAADPLSGNDEAVLLAQRYSTLAMVSVPVLVGAGVGLSYFYIGSWGGLYGSSYGVLVMAKAYLLLTMLLLGASNQRWLRALPGSGAQKSGTSMLLRVRRFSEAEIGLGLTALLAAASLTSQAPAVDLSAQDRVSAHEIASRLHWQAPSLSSPPLSALAPPTSLAAALPAQQFGTSEVSDANDRAWSEYNHHWAGLIVLAAALSALLHRTVPLGRLRTLTGNWPLLFLGLAVFILIRADPENWPLGPRPFWASFSRPDVLEHRLYALLIACFACFEWAVERGRIRSPRAAYVFPLLCAAGGAALLTHSHGLGDMHQEVLNELSHTSIAVLGATAGWGRWLELRLPGRSESRWAGRLWPLCLFLVGAVLMDYRES